MDSYLSQLVAIRALNDELRTRFRDGAVSGVAAIYNRHGYMDEMRAAIANWEKRLTEIAA